MNVEFINTVKYASDAVVLCDSLDGLQHLLNLIREAGEEMGLKINRKKY